MQKKKIFGVWFDCALIITGNLISGSKGLIFVSNWKF